MTQTKTLLATVALTAGTLLAFSPGARAASREPAKAGATAKAEKSKPKPRFRCRVGNGKGAHYVDSAYPCSETTRAAR